MIRWIVSDMDGTLLNEHNIIPDTTANYLIECQRNGIHLILASGRSYARLMPYVKQLQMDKYGGALIEVNGVALYNLTDRKRMVISQLEQKDKMEIYHMLEQFQPEIQFYEDESVYYHIPEWQIPLKEKEKKEKKLDKNYPLLGGAWSWLNDSIHNYPTEKRVFSVDEVPNKLNKINCLDSEEHIQRIYDFLQKNDKGLYNFTRTCKRLIEIVPYGITKGQTLKKFMNENGVHPDEVIAFGDGENDVDLFRQVSYGIAMDNAAEYVKKFANDMTASNRNEGVRKALEKYL